MSTRYPGGIISKTAPVPTGGESGTAPGVWTLEQAAYYIKQGQWPIPYIPKYVEDVFSTYLYTGNGSTQTITNNINLSGNGGLVWIKRRNGIRNHALIDTVRGASVGLSSNTTDANTTYSPAVMTAFNSNGFSLDSNIIGNNLNDTYVSWTFREQAKFFDIVTYTGNGVSGRTISHNLGSTPGCIIVKCTSTAGEYWAVYHTSTGPTKFLWLQDTIAATTASTYWNDTAPTSSVFSVGNDGAVNGNGKTYVAYLFAHNAGGFGATGTDNVISCGSYTGNATTGLAVTLGYEPQWVMVKCSSAAQADGWIMVDTMRSMDNSANAWLKANTSAAETAESPRIVPTATGFTLSSNAAVNTSGATYIYIAIRRGPMKTPTTGTSVFAPVARTGTGSAVTVSNSLVSTDATFTLNRGGGTYNPFVNRLVGTGRYLTPNDTVAEITQSETVQFDVNNAVKWPASTTFGGSGNFSGNTYINYFLQRAPGFFDVVCYTGTGVAGLTITHNLGVAPELIIIKSRNGAYNWATGSNFTASNFTAGLYLNSSGSGVTVSYPHTSFYSQPTSTTFSVGVSNTVNDGSTFTYVAYLFASCAGVSKVGSYTGTGTTQTINCGFTTGARFVMIKRTDSTGDWYVWDSARGIVAGNDPYLLLNSTAAEVTGTDYIDTANAGFEISSTAPSGINANGGTYLFLAIA